VPSPNPAERLMPQIFLSPPFFCCAMFCFIHIKRKFGKIYKVFSKLFVKRALYGGLYEGDFFFIQYHVSQINVST